MHGGILSARLNGAALHQRSEYTQRGPRPEPTFSHGWNTDETQPGLWPEPRDVRTTNKSNASNLRISVRSVLNRRLRSVLFYSSHSSDSWLVPSLSGLKIFAACEVKDGS